MAKAATLYQCSECGWTAPRWVGRCGECQAWGSVAESVSGRLRVAATTPSTPAVPITQVRVDQARALPTGLGELDRVLGDGLTPGAVVLLAGEPGVGKSTLLLEVAAGWARAGRRTLYVSAEESAAQVRLRAERTGAVHESLFLAAEADLGVVLGQIEQLSPELLVLDSVQTVAAPGTEGVPGGVSQVREVTAALVRVAKQRALPVMLIGHVTKEGAVAGPRTLEHLVDVVLSFEGEPHSGFRLLRASKNRFGPADEVGCFELTEAGIREVPDPSGLFTSLHEEPATGTCLTVSLAGRRPLLTEIQALVAPSAAPVPRRVTSGLDGARLSMILAVLQRRAAVKLHTAEVYASTVGGMRVADPAADLATAIAVASAAYDQSFVRPVIALGEVGLSGELRPVPGIPRRLGEAARLGFQLALVPAGCGTTVNGLRVIEVVSVANALQVLGVRKRSGDRHPPTPQLTVVEAASSA
ncbi:MAG: DNA repair protein RadA [Propionibacteriales bacterium]|nr:DNA repair protein RadA [Propionibacteriales bacterium]